MPALVGPLTMICGVLAIAGVAKIVSPQAARRALAPIGVPVATIGVRVLGSAELALAVVTVIVGGMILPAIVGALHLIFAAVVAVMMRRNGGVSCGCFGSLDTPVSPLHVGANLASAAVAFAAIGVPGSTEVLADQPGSGVAYVLAVLAGTAALLAVLTLVPQLRPHAPAAPAFSVRVGR